MPCQFWVCGESWVFLQLLTARPFKHNTRSQVFKFRIKQSLVTDITGEHRSGFFQPDLAVAPPTPHSSLRSMVHSALGGAVLPVNPSDAARCDSFRMPVTLGPCHDRWQTKELQLPHLAGTTEEVFEG